MHPREEPEMQTDRPDHLDRPERSRGADGIRAIAIFEAFKGVLVLVVGTGLCALMHVGVQKVGDELIRHLHLNPAHRSPRIFFEYLQDVSNHSLEVLALGAGAYSVLRFIEAYGLWRERAWAEWFAVVSGATYLPLEIYEIVRSPSLLTISLTWLNALMIGYLAWLLRRARGRDASRATVSDDQSGAC